MEPRDKEVQEGQSERKETPQRRFQIVKLEERIAPRGGYYRYHYPGWYKHGWSGPPGQVR